MYSMCQSKFEDMARDAGAIYKLNKLVLVNCDIFEEYLETSEARIKTEMRFAKFLEIVLYLLTGNK